jgi:hypothetical protein
MPDLEILDAGPSRRGWHRLQTVLQCPRKYALYTASKLNPQPTTAPPLIKGILLHIGLAHRYALKKNPKALLYPPLKAVEGMAAAQVNAEVWQEFVHLVQETLLQYDLRWEGEQWEVMDVERELVANIEDEERGEVYLYTQRADLVVRNKHSGLWYIVDHKSTFRISGKTKRRYTLSGQFRGYEFFGQGLLGKRFGGVILNMVQWPRDKVDAVFERVDLEPAPYANRTFKQTVIHAERLIRDLTPRHDRPLDWPGVHHETACFTAYGPCEYHTLCQWGTDK